MSPYIVPGDASALTLADFYAANPARAKSGECDYGVWWTDGKVWPHYRVSYVGATGEVYAVAMANPATVEVLGVVPPDKGNIFHATLDRILEGWADVSAHQLSWVRARLADAAYNTRGDDLHQEQLAEEADPARQVTS